MSVGDAFDSCRTDILILESPPSLPEVLSDDASWLSAIRECKPRIDAFYDEILELYLTVRLPFEEGTRDSSPPPYLVSLLLGLQIDLEGFYISSLPPTDVTDAPRDASFEKPGSQLPSSLARPQAFPPNTPHPHPVASPNDESYILSQGRPFESYSLRDRCQSRRTEARKFTLLRDGEQGEWLAVYHLDIRVAFETNQPTQPLLCLTTTLTLREQQTPIPPVSEALAKLWTGEENSLSKTAEQEKQTTSLDHKAILDVHQEGKNLLEGLQMNLKPKQLYFPFSRVLENQHLARRNPPKNDKSSFRHPVMRKAHRKTLRPLTPCHLQMFTALVPYMDALDDPDFEDDALPRASEERTVVLCLEIDSDGSDGHGFCIDSVEVRIQGEGCQTNLVGQESCPGFFPLHISPRSQYSLLYAILFKNQLPYKDILAAADRLHPSMAIQRAIAIEITGRPYRLQNDAKQSEKYLTSPFATRWNCTLDLNSIHVGGRGHSGAKLDGTGTVLPIPPSPFPATSLHELTSSNPRHDKRLGPLEKTSSKDKPLPPLNDRISSLIMERRTSVRGKRQSHPSTPDKESPQRPVSLQSAPSWSNIAFWPNLSSKNLVHEPFSASPFKVNQGDLGFSALSPSPINRNASLMPSLQPLSQSKPRVEDSLIISVQFVAEKGSTSPILYPGTRFGLEVFVFNKSSVTRELQICFAENTPVPGYPIHSPFVPLENNVRVGPLDPETCQAVRLHLLALEPGVHTIDNLMVMEIGSKRTMTLRSVADVVIKDPEHSDK